MQGLLYVGQVYAEGVVGVAVWPTAGLTGGCIVGVTGVADYCTGAV